MIRTRFPQFDAGIVSISSDSSSRARESERSSSTGHLTEEDAHNEGKYTEPGTHVHESGAYQRPADDGTDGRQACLNAPCDADKHERRHEWAVSDRQVCRSRDGVSLR